MMDTDPQGTEMEQQTINFIPDRKILLSVVDRHLCAKFPPKILKCTQKRHNYSISDFKEVPNYLCCDRPNILRTLFISPQVIFLHILLSLHSKRFCAVQEQRTRNESQTDRATNGASKRAGRGWGTLEDTCVKPKCILSHSSPPQWIRCSFSLRRNPFFEIWICKSLSEKI